MGLLLYVSNKTVIQYLNASAYHIYPLLLILKQLDDIQEHFVHGGNIAVQPLSRHRGKLSICKALRKWEQAYTIGGTSHTISAMIEKESLMPARCGWRKP